jgi:hypothetical protein
VSDREAAAKRIAASARAVRRPLPRWLWIAALAVAAICVGALAIGWLTAPSEPSSVPATTPSATTGLGAVAYAILAGAAGVGIGIALGRRRS